MLLAFRLLGLCVWMAPLSIWAGTLAEFRTPLGEMDVELYDADKPATVQNFIRYVQSGNYSNMFFHRWVPGFIIQGGGFYTADRHTTNAIIKDVVTFADITNEYSVGKTYSNLYGTLAMARVSGQTNSANSQWYFNLTNNGFLDTVDGGFTVFGRVVLGTNVLNRFNLTSTNNGIYGYNIGAPLDQMPVLSNNPGYEDLVYVDITLLHVQVERNLRGGAAVSWQSVSNQLNHVQFTTKIPPVWTELASTNGNGSVLRILDPAAGATNRFYRVTVDYP
jgi:cyclophilin family peptidyl-prolyl cis-trans isomerase